MTDNHLANAIRFCARGRYAAGQRLIEAYAFLNSLTGEMAIMSLENEIDALDQAAFGFELWLVVLRREQALRETLNLPQRPDPAPWKRPEPRKIALPLRVASDAE